MAGELDAGVISGRIELTDQLSPVLQAAIQKIDAIEGKFDTLNSTVKTISQTHQEAAGVLSHFGDQFTQMAERIAERLTIYALIREGLSFGKEAMDSAAALAVQSQALDIDTDSLQRLLYVAKDYNIEGDALTRGIEQLGQKLMSGDTNAVRAVDMLGLNIQKLIDMGPKEAFLAVTEAAGTLEDPMMKDVIAADLFGGRLGKQLIPLLGELREKLDAVPAVSIISDYDIEQAHKFEVGLSHVGTVLEAAVPGIFSMIGQLTGLAAKEDFAAESAAKFKKDHDAISVALGEFPAVAGPVITNAQAIQNELDALRTKALQPLTDLQKQNIADLHMWGEGEKEIAQLVGASKEAVHEYVAELTAKNAEDKKFAQGWADLNSLGKTYQDTIDGINPSIKDSVLYYAEMGAKVDDLINSFPGLTKVQAEAAISGAKAANDLLKIEIDTDTVVAKMNGDSIDDYINLQHKKYDETVKAAQLAGKAIAGFLDDELAHTNVVIAAEIQRREEMVPNSKASYKKIRDDAVATLDLMRDDQSGFTAEEIQNQVQVVREAQRNYDHWAAAAYDAHHKITDAAQQSGNQQIIIIDSVSAHWDMLGSTMDRTKIKVKTLAGELITLEEAEARQHAGGAFNVTSQNFESSIMSLITSGGTNPSGMGSNVDLNAATSLAHQGYSFQEIVAYFSNLSNGGNGTPPPPQGPRIPGFAEGGTVMVGEQGTEAVRLPFGSTVYPSGVSPAPSGANPSNETSMTSKSEVHLHVLPGAVVMNYPIVSDPRAMDQLGRLMGDAIIERLRNRGIAVGN